MNFAKCTFILTAALTLSIATKASDKEKQNLLPIIKNCNVEDRLAELSENMEVKSSKDDDFAPTHDDILPLWIKNDSIWVNKPLQLAIKFNKIETELPNKTLHVTLKNFCDPEHYVATGTIRLTKQHKEQDGKMNLNNIVVEGDLFEFITERIFISLSLQEADKGAKIKGKVLASFAVLEGSELTPPKNFEFTELNITLEK